MDQVEVHVENTTVTCDLGYVGGDVGRAVGGGTSNKHLPRYHGQHNSLQLWVWHVLQLCANQPKLNIPTRVGKGKNIDAIDYLTLYMYSANQPKLWLLDWVSL